MGGVEGPGWNSVGVSSWIPTAPRVWLIMSRLAGLPPRSIACLITSAPAGGLAVWVTSAGS